MFPDRKEVTEDGFEQTWAVNVLALYTLNALLVRHVSDRIINVSSISADSRIDFNNLNQVRRMPLLETIHCMLRCGNRLHSQHEAKV